MNLQLTLLSPHATVPTYGTTGAGAFDLYASEDIHVWTAQESASLVPTGIAVAIPPGHVMLVYPRSGHASKHGLRLANCVGVIDSDYRGEIKVPLVSDHPLDYGVLIHRGDRIAQAMIVPAPRVSFEVVEELPATARGEAGFGSTGR